MKLMDWEGKVEWTGEVGDDIFGPVQNLTPPWALLDVIR